MSNVERCPRFINHNELFNRMVSPRARMVLNDDDGSVLERAEQRATILLILSSVLNSMHCANGPS